MWTEQVPVIRSVFSQNAPTNRRRFKAAHRVAVAIGASNKAETNPRGCGSGADRILVHYAAPMRPRFGMPVPIPTKQRYMKALINQRANHRKSIYVATTNKKHVARRAGWCLFAPRPMNVRIMGEWQVMDGAHSTTVEIVGICLPRRKYSIVSWKRR